MPLTYLSSTFPARLLSSRTQVGIDFGTHSCKLAVVEMRGRQTVVTSVARFEIPPGDPLQSGFLRDTLQTWMWEQGLQTQEFSCALPQACTEYKCIELPPHAPSEEAALIQQALQDHCGANEQDSACDYWLTSSTQSPPVTSLHLSWTNPAFLKSLHAECEGVGLQCRVIDAQPFVLSRIASLCTPADRGSLVIDLGVSNTTFAWVCQSQPRYVRRVRNLAMGPFLQELANAFSLPSGELECLLRNMTWESPVFGSQLTPWLQLLHLEITRTLNYLKQRGECHGPATMVLCGGGSSLGGLQAYLQPRLEGEVRYAALPAQWRWRAPSDFEPAYAAALVLATVGGAL